MDASIIVERNVTLMLCILLGINAETSKIFSDSDASIPFTLKIALLSEINAIKKDDKAKLIKFSEIRNIFAHNYKISNFSECYKKNDLQNFLNKRYSAKVVKVHLFDEGRNKNLFELLFEDVKEICRNLFYQMFRKAENEGKIKGTMHMHESLMKMIEEECLNDDVFKNKMDEIFQKAYLENKLKNE